MKKSAKTALLILSALLLLCVVFVPLYGLGEGLFPDYEGNQFFEVIKDLFGSFWIEMLLLPLSKHIFLFLFSAAMLALSAFSKRIGVAVLSAASTAFLLADILYYAFGRWPYDGSTAFHPSNGLFAIGTWIILAMLIAAFVIALKGKGEEEQKQKDIPLDPRQFGSNYFEPIPRPADSPASEPANETAKCSCGAELLPGFAFCGSCGKKVEA